MFTIRKFQTYSCLMPDSSFIDNDHLTLQNCSKARTQLGKFFITETDTGKDLSTLFWSPTTSQVGEKCLWTSDEAAGHLYFEECRYTQSSWYDWDLIPTPVNNTFLIRHRLTGRCVKIEDHNVVSSKHCDINDPDAKWVIEWVLYFYQINLFRMPT